MKISLGEMFFLAPASLLGGILGLSILFSGPRDFIWNYEIIRTNQIRQYVERSLKTGDQRNASRATVKIINSWLASTQPSRHLGSANPPAPDYWGNPYRIKKDSDLLQHECLVYSAGEDGISISDGNDPDDIRCWEPNPGDFYKLRQHWRDAVLGVPLLLLCSTVIFSATIWGKRRIVESLTHTAG